MPPTIPRVVFDCNVFLQALVNPNGAAGRYKQLLDRGEIELFVSAQVLAEVAEVLSRPRVRKLAPALTIDEIAAFIDDIRRQSIFLANVPEEYHFERDPKDEPYLNLAIAAGVTYLVSKDKDLLDLMTRRTPEAQTFRKRYPMLTILDSPAFLNLMQARISG